MNLAQDVEQWLRYVEPAILLVLVVRLKAEALTATYRAFSFYLVFLLFQDLVPLLLGFELGSDRYAIWFFVSEPVTWILSYLVLAELFNLTLANFPGVRSAGKLLFAGGLAVALVVAVGTSIPSLLAQGGQIGLISLYSIIERSVMIVTLILLAALQSLIVHYSLPLPRNTFYYSLTYAIYFSARALQAFLVGTLGTAFISTANAVAMLIDVGCLLLLAWVLSRQGDVVQNVPVRRLSEQQREMLRGQLKQLNDAIGRVSRMRP